MSQNQPFNYPEISIGKMRIIGTNHQELLNLKKEIFDDMIYDVEFQTETPKILDIGAHVGLTTLYFKRLFPQSRIVAVEPQPELAKLLRENLFNNRMDDVKVIEAAVGGQFERTNFYMDATDDKWWSTASLLEGAWNQKQQSVSVEVEVMPLDPLLTEPVDLLKMDVEGVEDEVLASATRLFVVKNLVFEVHGEVKEKTVFFKKLLKQSDLELNRSVPSSIMPLATLWFEKKK